MCDPVDVTVVSTVVAGLLTPGRAKELGEAEGGGLVAGIVRRVGCTRHVRARRSAYAACGNQTVISFRRLGQ